MVYNYYFEIAAIIIACVVLYDYKNKMRVFRTDAVLFKGGSFDGPSGELCESDFLRAAGIRRRCTTGIEYSCCNFVFIVQAFKLYMLSWFSFTYMNPHFSKKNPWFVVLSGIGVVNAVLGILTPWTGFYFYFDEERKYVQGFGTNWGFYFYIINILACLIYALMQRKRILDKDMQVAGWTAVIIGFGVYIQFIFRSTLTVGFSVAVAMLLICI